MSRVRRRDSNAAELSPRPRRARPSSNRASLASRSRRRATNASSASSSMSSRARADARVGGAVASSSSRRHRDGEKPLRDATNARASAEIDARDVEAFLADAVDDARGREDAKRRRVRDEWDDADADDDAAARWKVAASDTDADDDDDASRGALTTMLIDAHRSRANGRGRTDDGSASERDDEIERAADEDEEGFETSDGEVSLHSESSQDRTRGVKSFAVADVVNERFGKGKRGMVRRTAFGKSVEDVLSRGPAVSWDEDDFDDDDDDDENEAHDHASSPVRESESPGVVVVGEVEASPARRRRAVPPSEAVSPTVLLVRDNSTGRRTQTFGEINKSALARDNSTQPRITTVFTKAAAPWKFDHRVFGDRAPTTTADNTTLAAFERSNDDDLEWTAAVEEAKVEGLRVLEKAMKDFVSRRSVGRVGASARTPGDSNEMTLDEIDGWGHAMALLERADGLWTGLRETLPKLVEAERETIRKAAKLERDTLLDDSSHARSLEVAWELTFIAAKLWYSKGYQLEHAVGTDWATQAWAVVGWLLDESRVASFPVEPKSGIVPPTHFSQEEYTQAICERIAELVAWWPRCTADRHPVRVLWKLVHGASVNSGAAQDWRLTARKSAACCQACMPLVWRPYDESFKAANARFVTGTACEALYRALGDHLAKCACEHKVLRRELGKWLPDARLSKITDEVCAYKNSDNEFRALGGHTFPLSPAALRLQHRASVHIELFRACAQSSLDDQAMLCLKQIFTSLASQINCRDDPAPRCILLRAVTTCLGIWLARGAKSSEWGRAKPAEEAVRAMTTLADCQKMTGALEPSIPGTTHAFADGAVIAEASAAWATAFAVLGCAATECRNEGLETLGALDKRALSSDWRERVFTSRSLATIYSPGSFSDKYGLKDFDLTLCSWLAFAADSVAGGAAPLAVALCARSELLTMNQQASPVPTVGWSQSKGGAAVAAVLRGKTKIGGESHVVAAGERPGALLTSKEGIFRAAVATLVTKELNKPDVKSDVRVVSTMRRIALALPAHCVGLYKRQTRARDGSHESNAPYARIIGALVREMATHCASIILLADTQSAENIRDQDTTFALPRLSPSPPSTAWFWGSRNERSPLGELLATNLEASERDVFRARLCAIDDAMKTAQRDSNERVLAVTQRQLAIATFGVLEAITGTPNSRARERSLVESLAKALQGIGNKPFGVVGDVAMRRYLPHFVLSALRAPQKCAARRVITSVEFMCDLMTNDEDESHAIAPSMLLSSMAFPLIVMVHEATDSTRSGDHHATASVAAVLTDILVPLFGGRRAAREVENKSATSSSTTTTTTTVSKQRKRQERLQPHPRPLQKPSSTRARFPFPGARAQDLPQEPRRPVTNVPTSISVAVTGTAPNVQDRTILLDAALNSNAVWRVTRAYAAASVSFLVRAALASPASREQNQVSVNLFSKSKDRSPRALEIERLKAVLATAQKLNDKSVALERKEAERALSDALAPLPETAVVRESCDLGDVRWGDPSSTPALAPNAFYVEESASERGRALLVAATKFLAQCASSTDDRARDEVSRRVEHIEAAVTFLLDPEAMKTSSSSASVASALRALSRALGSSVRALPARERR